MSGTLRVTFERHEVSRVEYEVENAPDEATAQEAIDLFQGWGAGYYLLDNGCAVSIREEVIDADTEEVEGTEDGWEPDNDEEDDDES